MIILIFIMLAQLKIKIRLWIRSHLLKLNLALYIARSIPIRIDISLSIEYERGLIVSILFFNNLKTTRPDLGRRTYKARKKFAKMLISSMNTIKLKQLEVLGEIGINNAPFETVAACAVAQILITNVSLFLMNKEKTINKKPIVNILPCFNMSEICLNLECIVDINLLKLISKDLCLLMRKEKWRK